MPARRPSTSRDAAWLIESYGRALDDQDVRVRLGVVAELRTLVRELERAAVDDARRHGLTWAKIAESSGIPSRQAAYGRWQRASVRQSV